MHKGFIRMAAVFGALSVALGAFAAHTLRQTFSPDEMAIFETGVKYQFYHTFGLFLAGILYREFHSGAVTWAGRLFLAGIILFSGSLYMLAAAKFCGMDSLNWLGAVTPFGGVSFIAGWIFVFVAVARKN